MARCYGRVLLQALLDLRLDEGIRPTAVELELFAQLHLPQPFLGGLPLAFFGRSPLRWFTKPLFENWRDEEFRPEAHGAVTDLLGVFGTLVAERRERDRKEKQPIGQVKPSGDLFDVVDHRTPPSPVALDALLCLPIDARCATCRTKLQYSGRAPLPDADDWLVTTYCRRCDVERDYRLAFPTD